MTNPNPIRIDAIIPVFNGEHFIERALRSIDNGTVLPETVWVIDDCSTDRTAKLVSDFAKSAKAKIKLVRLSEKAGASGARNFGINLSKADYVAFLDADDEWQPDFLNSILKAVTQDQKTDLVYAFSEYAESPYLLPSMRSEKDKEINGTMNPRAIYSDLASIKACALAIRLALLQKIGGYRNLRIGEDTDLYLRLAETGANFRCIPKKLAIVHRHETNTTNDQALVLKSRLEFFRLWIDTLFQNRKDKADLILRLVRNSIVPEWKDIRQIPKRAITVRNVLSKTDLKNIFGRFPFSFSLKLAKQTLIDIHVLSRLTFTFENMLDLSVSGLFRLRATTKEADNETIVRNGLFLKEFRVFSNDKTFGLFYKNHGFWEMSLSLYLRKICSSAATFLDIGANAGYFSCLALSVMKEGFVFAVDANPHMASLLKKNTDLYKRQFGNDCEVVCAAAGKVSGANIDFFQFEDVLGNSSVFRPDWPEGKFKQITVETVTVDELLKNRKLDILRIDAEGSEAEILAGAKNAISRNQAIIIILEFLPALNISEEYSPEPLKSELKKLTDQGFKLYSISALGRLRKIDYGMLENFSGNLVIRR